MWPTRKRWKKWICSVWGRWRGSGVTTCQCKTELLQGAAKGRDRSRGRSFISKATPTLSSSNFCSTAWQGQPCYRKRREWQWDGAEQAVQSIYGSPGTSPIASMSSSHTHTLRSASLPSEALPSPLISWQPSRGSGSSLLVASAGVYVQEERRDSDSQHRQTRAEVTAEPARSHRQLLLATAGMKCHHLRMSFIPFNSDGYVLGALCYYSAFFFPEEVCHFLGSFKGCL